MNNKSFSSDDLWAALGALESWLDAFSDEEPEMAKQVMRVYDTFSEYFTVPVEKRPHLRIVKGPEGNSDE